MPELPDLQAFSRNLNKKLKGKTVVRLEVHARKAKTTQKAFREHIEGQKIAKVYREGKQLYIGFGNGTVLALHLMLHGALHLFEGKNTHPHTVLDMSFDDGSGFALTDWQGAATPALNPETPSAPDALSAGVDAAFLREKFKGRASVKNILLDQKVIRGIGNAYADEILYEARISPFSVASRIPPEKITALARAIRYVLAHAEKQILQSHPDIISGEVRDFLQVHHAKKTHSPGGAAIKTRVNGGRKTYYTDEQEEYT